MHGPYHHGHRPISLQHHPDTVTYSRSSGDNASPRPLTSRLPFGRPRAGLCTAEGATPNTAQPHQPTLCPRAGSNPTHVLTVGALRSISRRDFSRIRRTLCTRRGIEPLADHSGRHATRSGQNLPILIVSSLAVVFDYRSPLAAATDLHATAHARTGCRLLAGRAVASSL